MTFFNPLALRCPTQLQNVILLNCLPFPGFACDFDCKKGYRRVTDTTLSCESTGQWSMPTDSLCEGLYNTGNIFHKCRKSHLVLFRFTILYKNDRDCFFRFIFAKNYNNRSLAYEYWGLYKCMNAEIMFKCRKNVTL